jgi:MFS family permease
MERTLESKSGHTEITPRQQLIATCAAFFILGAAFATWASRIPAIRDIASLTPVTLGYVLLGKGIGTVLIMPLVMAGINKIGAKKSAAVFGLGIIVMLIPMTLAPTWEMLSVVLFLSGAAGSGYNICINALGSKIETDTGKSHMALIHSWFGVGNFAGALAGTGLASWGFTASSHFWGIAFTLLLLLAVIYKFLPEDEPDPSANKTGLTLPHKGLIWIGLICFFAGSIEESINNWTTLFFTDYVGTSDGLAPIGFSAYAGSLLLMRLVGDRLKPKYGAKSLLIVGNLVAVGGLATAILIPNLTVAIIGFIAAGLGVALSFPMVFSAAGKEGAMALTSVATMGVFGGMLSQPIMGFLVDNFQLSGGFLFIAACMMAVSVLSWKAQLLRK